ncbi:hypothetical protein C8R44DRAFT_614069, partial [Mycena epipterygia]
MKEAKSKGKPGKKNAEKRTEIPEVVAPKSSPAAVPVNRTNGRQSELSATVDRMSLMDRILDVPVTMTLREVMVTSKELRTEFQDLIKVKNVKAVLLGNSQDHPLIANLDWPRTEGILIKIEMETNGKPVCAIIDTGSQLDVVRADV